MSTLTQRVCVPAMPSRSRPSVPESSFWMVPPVETPNTSEPNALWVDVVVAAGVVVGVGRRRLRRAARARLAAARQQALRRAARALAERAFLAPIRQRASGVLRGFLAPFLGTAVLATGPWRLEVAATAVA